MTHNHSNGYVTNKTGSLIFENANGDDQLHIAQNGGALKYDNVTKLG